MRFSWRGALKSPVPIHDPTHLPEMSAPVDDALGAGAAGAGAAGAGAGVLAATGAFAAGVGVAATGVGVTVAGSVLVPAAGAPVVSVVPAVVSVGWVSTRVADGSDELKTEHAARSGIMASTSSTRIEPPDANLRSQLPVARVVPDLKNYCGLGLRGRRVARGCQDYTSDRDNSDRTERPRKLSNRRGERHRGLGRVVAGGIAEDPTGELVSLGRGAA